MLSPFVDGGWLRDHREEVVVADVRFYLDGRSGRAAHEAGHVPGAVFVDLATVLAGPATDAGGRHPLPDPATFARGMAAAGIGDDDVVVAYDDAGGVMAARLVWMLRAIGRDAALLDGGLAAWDGPLEQAPPSPSPAIFTAGQWPPERLATIDDAADRRNVVLDARPPARYAGAADLLDPRAGHVPGARNVPAAGAIGADGRLLPVEDLRARFADAGVTDAAEVVSSCGSGVTACFNLLAMEHAGLGRGRLFPGSWSAWSRDRSRPVVTGHEPG